MNVKNLSVFFLFVMNLFRCLKITIIIKYLVATIYDISYSTSNPYSNACTYEWYCCIEVIVITPIEDEANFFFWFPASTVEVYVKRAAQNDFFGKLLLSHELIKKCFRYSRRPLQKPMFYDGYVNAKRPLLSELFSTRRGRAFSKVRPSPREPIPFN